MITGREVVYMIGGIGTGRDIAPPVAVLIQSSSVRQNPHARFRL
jgi:hypothetical protein